MTDSKSGDTAVIGVNLNTTSTSTAAAADVVVTGTKKPAASRKRGAPARKTLARKVNEAKFQGQLDDSQASLPKTNNSEQQEIYNTITATAPKAPSQNSHSDVVSELLKIQAQKVTPKVIKKVEKPDLREKKRASIISNQAVENLNQ